MRLAMKCIIIQTNIKNNKNTYFKNNVLSNTKNETICDFAKLIYILKKNITKYSELNSSLIIIQNIYKNKLTKLNQNNMG